MYSNGPPIKAEQNQYRRLERTYSSSVRIRDVALKTCQKRWTIGRSGERGSWISMLAARHDDDDDETGCLTKEREHIFQCYLPITGRRTYVMVPLSKELARRETLTTLSRIWTPVTDFIFYDDSHNTKCAPEVYCKWKEAFRIMSILKRNGK